jgi:cardiolipin synthase
VLVTLAMCGAIVSCKSLPDVEPGAAPKAVPTIATANGTLPVRKASALVTQRWAHASGDLKALAAMEEQATGVPLIAGNKVTLLFDGPATMREMIAAARAATSSINLETYIFDEDEIGSEFAALLLEKQRQGVQVNIMVDAVGNLSTPSAFFARMRAGGIRVVTFNPVNPTKAKGKWEVNNRDHRKLMVVDGRSPSPAASTSAAPMPTARCSARKTRPGRSTATRSAGATPTSRSRVRPWARCSGPSSICGCSRMAATCPMPSTSPGWPRPATSSCACWRPRRSAIPRSTNRW